MNARTALFLLFALLACISSLGSARADSLSELFSRGNAAFARGEYAEAVEAYEALLESGVDDPDVTFNLASAYGAEAEYGQAIRYFERTLELAPGDEQARAELQKARDALGERQAQAHGEAIIVDRPPLTKAVFSSFTADTLAWLLLVTIWLAVGLLFVLRLTRDRTRDHTHGEALSLGLGIAAALSFALAVASALGLGAKADWGRDGTRAVVLREDTALREGPDDRARLRAELVEGETVRVMAREGLFTRIVARGDQAGYVRSDAVGEI